MSKIQKYDNEWADGWLPIILIFLIGAMTGTGVILMQRHSSFILLFGMILVELPLIAMLIAWWTTLRYENDSHPPGAMW